jgi:cell division septal protein FtsQ
VSRGARPARRRGSSHARRPTPGIGRSLRRYVPPRGRLVAALLTAILVSGLLALLNGPWLRVAQVTWSGQRYTEARQLQLATASLDGAALLGIDAGRLAAELEALPAVRQAQVEAQLPDAVRITIQEKAASFIWQTIAVRLVGSADGTLIGQVALRATLPPDLAALPLIDDRRSASRDIIVGDQIDAFTLAAALRLQMVQPSELGSRSPAVGVRLTDSDGFLIVSRSPAWQADFGFYPPLDTGEPGSLEQLVTAQVAAVRTLFATQPESGVSWVDVRDPGRVYWRP